MSTNLYNRFDCFWNDKNDADNIIFKQKKNWVIQIKCTVYSTTCYSPLGFPTFE